MLGTATGDEYSRHSRQRQCPKMDTAATVSHYPVVWYSTRVVVQDHAGLVLVALSDDDPVLQYHAERIRPTVVGDLHGRSAASWICPHLSLDSASSALALSRG